MKNRIQTTFLSLFLISFCLNSYAEKENKPGDTNILPGIGTSKKDSKTKTSAYPFYGLTSCSQGLGRLQANTLPIQPTIRTVISDTTNWAFDNLGVPLTKVSEVENILFIGDATNPRVALLTAATISAYPIKVFLFDYPNIYGRQLNDFKPGTAYRLVPSSKSKKEDLNIEPVTFKNYPEIDDSYTLIKTSNAEAFGIPLDQVVDINLGVTNLSQEEQLQIANEISSLLRKGMDNFVEAMVFKARERVGLEKRTLWHNPNYDIYDTDFNSFRKTFCDCKDLKGFEGFETETVNKLLDPNNSFGSILIFHTLTEPINKITPIKNSELNCNLS